MTTLRQLAAAKRNIHKAHVYMYRNRASRSIGRLDRRRLAGMRSVK